MSISDELFRLDQKLDELDMERDILEKYTDKLDDLNKGVNTMLAPIFIRDFTRAQDVASTLFAKISAIEIRVNHLVEMAEAEAYLDKSPDVLKAKGIKDTVEAKKHCVALDPEVMKANDLKAKTSAMHIHLRNKVMTFKMAHEAVKKMAYSGDYSNSPNEGM